MSYFKLEPGEAFNAAVAGLQRRFKAIQREAKDNQGGDLGDRFVTDIHGAIAELTVAKALNLYCNLSSSDRDLPDVGFNVEVRSSTNVKADMPIRPKDTQKPNFANTKFYFVVGIYPRTTIVGWLYGKDCVKPEYWKEATNNPFQPNRTSYWAVPQSALNPELIEVTDEALFAV